jgi:hypothetical protein
MSLPDPEILLCSYITRLIRVIQGHEKQYSISRICMLIRFLYTPDTPDKPGYDRVEYRVL